MHLMFWKISCYTYLTLINPPYSSSKVDYSLYCHYMISGANTLYSYVKYLTDVLGVLEDPHILGLFVYFGCIYHNIGVCYGSLYVYIFPTVITAPVSTSFIEYFPIMPTPPDSNLSLFVKFNNFSMPNLASYQGQILPVILHRGFYTGP